MWAAATLAASLLLVPAPDGDSVDFSHYLRTDTATFVSLDVPWDGSEIEISAKAEAPEPEAVAPEVGDGAGGTDGDAISRMAVPTGGSAAELLATIAASDHSAVRSVSNGSMPSSLLCAIPWSPGYSVYCPALEPLKRLNSAYSAAFGKNLSFASAYRPGYQGRSFHGWGMALDINGSSGLMRFGEAEYNWMMVNAPNYGWYSPFWAGAGGSNPEAWHWEFGSYYRGTSADFASAPVPNRPLIIKH